MKAIQKVTDYDLLLEFLIVAFDAPAQFGNINKRCKLDVFLGLA
jgi:hypothetical protein